MSEVKKKLRVRWDLRSNDMMYLYPSAPDGHLMHTFFNHTKLSTGKTLVEELKERGYDIKTIKFSIERLPKDPQKE